MSLPADDGSEVPGASEAVVVDGNFYSGTDRKWRVLIGHFLWDRGNDLGEGLGFWGFGERGDIVGGVCGAKIVRV